jgi:hypothetical protein
VNALYSSSSGSEAPDDDADALTAVVDDRAFVDFVAPPKHRVRSMPYPFSAVKPTAPPPPPPPPKPHSVLSAPPTVGTRDTLSSPEAPPAVAAAVPVPILRRGSDTAAHPVAASVAESVVTTPVTVLRRVQLAVPAADGSSDSSDDEPLSIGSPQAAHTADSGGSSAHQIRSMLRRSVGNPLRNEPEIDTMALRKVRPAHPDGASLVSDLSSCGC